MHVSVNDSNLKAHYFSHCLLVVYSGIDFDAVSTVPLFRVGLPEMLPEAENMAFSCGELPKRWSLKKTSDGLGYRLKKEMSFSILLR